MAGLINELSNKVIIILSIENCPPCKRLIGLMDEHKDYLSSKNITYLYFCISDRNFVSKMNSFLKDKKDKKADSSCSLTVDKFPYTLTVDKDDSLTFELLKSFNEENVTEELQGKYVLKFLEDSKNLSVYGNEGVSKLKSDYNLLD